MIGRTMGFKKPESGSACSPPSRCRPAHAAHHPAPLRRAPNKGQLSSAERVGASLGRKAGRLEGGKTRRARPLLFDTYHSLDRDRRVLDEGQDLPHDSGREDQAASSGNVPVEEALRSLLDLPGEREDEIGALREKRRLLLFFCGCCADTIFLGALKPRHLTISSIKLRLCCFAARIISNG